MRRSMLRDFSQAFSFPARRLLVRFTSSKLFIGGLSFDTNETALRDAFAEHGEIIEVKVICDRMTSKSKGYGFVQFSSQEAATIALQKMHVIGWKKHPRGICREGMKLQFAVGFPLKLCNN
ncbi:glycine-rich RNA-binding protein 2, mitochondrial-like isoform X1 [Zingiber officinale]|uniref:glycine-rich RNA-binding protein 2, mitochondrial-like isoform X1 n=1 Tax=Zingiber officinale TaxID=94328 RepID=UPI001C4B9222|nr:glycine-rich RNA-binding protein 2, mitochondrial-like isoform X1 [Zingiber officinale]XP_042380769.1 glycine-rich RNA-binding protein 2, mitochondrial-like isoform X1 [Zingiber officinale]